MKQGFRRRFCRAILLMIFWYFPVALPAQGGARAFLVGVSMYQDPLIQNLPGIGLDLERMKEVFLALGVPPEEIHILTGTDASLAAIREMIGGRLDEGLGRRDRVFIYFSGHGSQLIDLDGDEDDPYDEAILPSDAWLGDGALANALVDDEIHRLLLRLRVGEVIVFLDACYSGTATRSLGGWPRKILDGSQNRLSVDAPTIFTLSASRSNEEARGNHRGSLFTRAIHEAVLRSPKRWMSPADLREYAEEWIVGELEAEPELRHRPFLDISPGSRMDGNGEINLFTVSGTRSAHGDIWDDLSRLVDSAPRSVGVLATSRIPIGRSLRASLHLPTAGHLVLFNLAEKEQEISILFPNVYEVDGEVERGILKLPRPDVVYPAMLPGGTDVQKNFLFALVLEKPIHQGNFLEESTGAFKTMTHQELRRVLGSARILAGGLVEVDIVRDLKE